MFETVEVLETIKNEDCRVPISLSIEKQVRIRDDESKSMPFVKLKILIGSRAVYLDFEQAELIAPMLEEMVPKAKAAVSQLKEDARAAREEREQRRNRKARRVMSPGKTARNKQAVELGLKKSHEQKKRDKSQRDRELRNKMKAGRGQK